MQSIDARLRDDLATLAEGAGPLRLTPEQLVRKVRVRRWRYTLATSTAAALVVGAVVWLGLNAGGPKLAPADVSPSQVGRPFVCGEQLVLGEGAAASRADLTMALSTVRHSADDVGPDLAVTFTADRPLQVRGSPTTLFEVLYLLDGVIVGGGPMLNEAGDSTPQGLDLIGSGFSVAPGQPYTEDLGRRDRLCGPVTWPEVWSQRQRYEVVLVQGQVTEAESPDTLRLDIPTLGHGPLLVARADLGG